MIYDKYPELDNEFNQPFRARGYCATTIVNIAGEVIKNILPLDRTAISPYRAKIKPPVELHIGDYRNEG